MKRYFVFLFLFLLWIPLSSDAAMQLIERMSIAQPGDYIVTAIDSNYTVLIIRSQSAANHELSVEEISVPASRAPVSSPSWQGWRRWVEDGAQGNTSWLIYTIDTKKRETTKLFSYTQQRSLPIIATNQFLSKLLHLSFTRVAKKDTKRIGPPPPQGGKDPRRSWAPRMIYEGKVIPNIEFEAWMTRWPEDGGDLSGKVITVYTPKNASQYPAYFPYWLEVQGLVGKAKIRIVDSGRDLFQEKGR